MSPRLAPLLVLLAAGCAGGDLMRVDGEGGSLAEEDAGTGTGGSQPVTTGLTGLTGTPQGSEGTTTAQPGPDADSDSTGAQRAESSTGGVDESGTGEETTGETDDSDGESGSSTTDLDPPEESLDVSGWTLVQTGSDRTFVFPPDTIIPAGAVLVLGRDATRGAFAQHWGPIDPSVLYINSEDTFPAINGDETFSVQDLSDVVVDGPTPAMASGQVMQRSDLSAAGSWTSTGEGSADPGAGHAFSGTSGLFITEVSDATGSGAYVYEFVELQAWP